MTADSSQQKTEQTDNPRLPCRGCTENCLNYPVCNGTPWRLADSVAKQNNNAS